MTEKQYPDLTQIIRDVGGIVHSDGNIFFTNAEMFKRAADRAMRARESAAVAEPVAWRLTNTSFRKPQFEYHDTKDAAEQRQADFNRAVDDGGLHNLTPLYAALATQPGMQHATLGRATQPQRATPSQDAEDAARYRWLRDGNNVKQSPAVKIATSMYGLEWDAAIDTARAQQEKK